MTTSHKISAPPGATRSILFAIVISLSGGAAFAQLDRRITGVTNPCTGNGWCAPKSDYQSLFSNASSAFIYGNSFSTETSAQTDQTHFFTAKNIQDSTPISLISLVGTHDSFATGNGGDIARTQTLSISEQLKAGARIFDLRLARSFDSAASQKRGAGPVSYGKLTLEAFHGPIDLGADVTQAFNAFSNFLAENKNEFVVVRIKEEQTGCFLQSRSAINCPSGSTFASGVYDVIYKNYASIIFDRNDPATQANLASNHHIINYGNIKGKVLVLADYSYEQDNRQISSSISNFRFGLRYYASNNSADYTYTGNSGHNLRVQDHYSLSTNWDLYYEKWTKIRDYLYLMWNSAIPPTSPSLPSASRTDILVNFLNGSGGSFPYFVAGGRLYGNTNAPHLWTGLLDIWPNAGKYPDFPRDGLAIDFSGTNELTSRFIDVTVPAANKLGYSGAIHGMWFFADFIGHGLVEQVSRLNSVGETYVPQPWLFSASITDSNGNHPLSDLSLYIRYNSSNGNIECYSKDGGNGCAWGYSGPTDQNAPPLMCGDMHKRIYGITGYENPNHWCSRGLAVLRK